MRANLLITTCVGVLCTTVVRLDQPAYGVSLPFQDGFENIAVGDYPHENGWNILFSGKDARVTDACAHSGTRSFCLNSYPNWAHMDYLYLDQIPDRLTYEVSIRVDPVHGRSALAGFMKAVGGQGPVWNYFWVGDTGEVQFVGLDGTHVGAYTPGTWCTVRADLDFVNQKADLWMNGTLVVEDVGIRPKEFDDPGWGHVVLNQWGVDSCNYSGGSDNVVYFDDVRLYEIREATIDIKPGSSPNSINIKSKGVIPVAILTTSKAAGDKTDFDASTVDPQSVRFGPGTTPPTKWALEDVDGDGDVDMILHFRTEQTGFSGTDTEGTLTGQTSGGVHFTGTDSVRVIGG